MTELSAAQLTHDEIRERVNVLMGAFVPPHMIAVVWRTPVAFLGGLTPEQGLEAGRGADILEMACDTLDASLKEALRLGDVPIFARAMAHLVAHGVLDSVDSEGDG